MSEVKRYDCSNGNAKFCYGCYQMDENPYGPWVQALDFDAAQSELATLRDEISEVKGEYDRAVNTVAALRDELARYQAGHESLYDRMVAAEQRNSELLKAVEQSIEWFERISSGDGSGHADLARAVRRIAKLPKPTESGASE